MNDKFEIGTLLVVVATFLLFLAALFSKGITHDLFLEGGVFLVSVKLIMMSYKIRRSNKEIQKKLDAIKRMLEKDCD